MALIFFVECPFFSQFSLLATLHLPPLPDPSFLGPVPNLDGGEGHLEQIIFGTNVDLTGPSEEGQSQPPQATGQIDQSGHAQHDGEEALEDKMQQNGRREDKETNQLVEGDS